MRYRDQVASPVLRARKLIEVPAVAATVIRPCDPEVPIFQPVAVVIVMTPELEPSTLITVKSKDELLGILGNAASVKAAVGNVYAAALEPGAKLLDLCIGESTHTLRIGRGFPVAA